MEAHDCDKRNTLLSRLQRHAAKTLITTHKPDSHSEDVEVDSIGGHDFSNSAAMTGHDCSDERNTLLSRLHRHAAITLAHKPDSHSEDVEVDSSGGAGAIAPVAPAASDPKKQKKGIGEGGGGGEEASIEVVRRPRGRPPGSKNKPKPPVVITRDAVDSHDALRPHILEVPAGHDVVEALARFSSRRNLGLTVLAGTGPVSNVTLRQPSLSSSPPSAAAAAAIPSITFHGRFEILSISATFFPPNFSASSSFLPSSSGGLSISLAGPQGQIVGGSVSGPLVAAGTVTIIAAAFSNPTFHRIPAEEEFSVSITVSGDGGGSGGAGGDGRQQQYHQHHHGSGGGGAAAATSMPAESAGMSIYSCHIPSDVIWTPTARALPHPPPY